MPSGWRVPLRRRAVAARQPAPAGGGLPQGGLSGARCVPVGGRRRAAGGGGAPARWQGRAAGALCRRAPGGVLRLPAGGRERRRCHGMRRRGCPPFFRGGHRQGGGGDGRGCGEGRRGRPGCGPSRGRRSPPARCARTARPPAQAPPAAPARGGMRGRCLCTGRPPPARGRCLCTGRPPARAVPVWGGGRGLCGGRLRWAGPVRGRSRRGVRAAPRRSPARVLKARVLEAVSRGRGPVPRAPRSGAPDRGGTGARGLRWWGGGGLRWWGVLL